MKKWKCYWLKMPKEIVDIEATDKTTAKCLLRRMVYDAEYRWVDWCDLVAVIDNSK